MKLNPFFATENTEDTEMTEVNYCSSVESYKGREQNTWETIGFAFLCDLCVLCG
jgi:hypothetical protein